MESVESVGRARRSWIALGLAAAASLTWWIPGCSSDSRDFFIVHYDAGTDAEAAAPGQDAEVDPTIGGPCSEDTQCNDDVACTFDRCDKTISRCKNTPDDAQCADPEYCNGVERCVLRQGCVAGAVVACEDGDGCTIDRCVEATKQCEHAQRDADGDGDPDDHCQTKADCDDTDPTVSSKSAEICDNAKDDDCDGTVDEAECAQARNDACSTAITVHAAGTFLLSTVAAKKDYATTCTVAKPASAHDIVVAITVPTDGGPRDVHVKATTNPANDVAVVLETTCGAPASDIACGQVTGSPEARAIARSAAPGSTLYAVVTTQTESAVDVTVDFQPGGAKPPNEDCQTPAPVNVGEAFTVSLVDPKKDLPSSCLGSVGELTYSFTLDEPHDVRIFASTLSGPGSPVVSIRDTSCIDELVCKVGSSPAVFTRSLAQGTHVFSVAGTTQLDASIVVQTYPPTVPPPNQTCLAPPVLTAGTALDVDLSTNGDAIQNGCLPGGQAAAYDLELNQPSDVLVIERVPGTDTGGLSLNLPACKPADILGCSTGSADPPIRVSKRNLPLGSYRVVVADQKALTSQVLALVRPALPPVSVTTDSCADTVTTIPETGGFFTGITVNMTANFDAGCDTLDQPTGGAKDQILRFVLSQRRRVIFDMTGSSYSTLLDLRTGSTCPGLEIGGACVRGQPSIGSYLDTTLDAGTYWVQVDGFAGSTGSWNLDVRVLPP